MITLQGAELAIPLETSWHPGGCPDQAGCWGLVEIIRCVCVGGGPWLWVTLAKPLSLTSSGAQSPPLKSALTRESMGEEKGVWLSACLRLRPQP